MSQRPTEMTHTVVFIAQEVMRVVIPGSLVGRWNWIVYDFSDAGDVQILGDESSVVQQVGLCLR